MRAESSSAFWTAFASLSSCPHMVEVLYSYSYGGYINHGSSSLIRVVHGVQQQLFAHPHAHIIISKGLHACKYNVCRDMHGSETPTTSQLQQLDSHSYSQIICQMSRNNFLQLPITLRTILIWESQITSSIPTHDLLRLLQILYSCSIMCSYVKVNSG